MAEELEARLDRMGKASGSVYAVGALVVVVITAIGGVALALAALDTKLDRTAAIEKHNADPTAHEDLSRRVTSLEKARGISEAHEVGVEQRLDFMMQRMFPVSAPPVPQWPHRGYDPHPIPDPPASMSPAP